MGVVSESAKDKDKVTFSIRVTREEQQVIASAAKEQHRSINNFVLRAALDAARSGHETIRTPEAIQQAVDRAQALMAPYKRPGHSLVDQLIAERRLEAERE